MKVGGDIEFGNVQGIGTLNFVNTLHLENHNKQHQYITIQHACLGNSSMLGCKKHGKQVGVNDMTPIF